MQWIPIEAAPKDGTKILLVVDDNLFIGFWNGRSWDDGDFYDDLGAASHWMPLPVLPALSR